MNKILSFKKIVSIGFFAAFLAVFLSAGTAQASFWDWFNLNKADKEDNSSQQQTAAVANAETTYKWVNNGSVSKSDSRATGNCSSKKQVTTYTCSSSTKGNKLYDGTSKGSSYGDIGHAWPIYEGENTSTATEYTYDGCSQTVHNTSGTVNEWECKSSDSTTSSSSSSATSVSKPTVTTGSATNITSNSATISATINNGGASSAQAGIYYIKSNGSSWTLAVNKTLSGSGDQDISADITDLSSGTKYYYQAKAQNSAGVKTGSQKSFTTSGSSSNSSSVSSGASSSSSSVQQYTLKVKISGAGKITSSGGSSVINCKKSIDSKGKSETSGDCSVKFNKGESVTLTVSTPSTKYGFATWAEDCRSAQKLSSCTIKMSGNKTVSATFNKKSGSSENTATVSVRKTGKGVGKVVSMNSKGGSMAGINCGTDCSENFKQYCDFEVEGNRRCGTVYFKATADKGSTFGGWGGDCLTFKNKKDQCYVILDGDKSVNASFNEGSGNTEGKYYDLTVTVSEGGTVTTTDNKINCSSTNSPCKHSYGKNGTVTLKVTPNSGYALGDYSGCSKSGNVQNGVLTCKAKMTQNRNVKINFKASGTTSSSSSSSSQTSSKQTLKVKNSGEGMGYVYVYERKNNKDSLKKTCNLGSGSSCEYQAEKGIYLRAYAKPYKSTFNSWENGCENEQKNTYDGDVCNMGYLNSDKTATVKFSKSSSISSSSSNSSSSSSSANITLKITLSGTGSVYRDGYGNLGCGTGQATATNNVCTQTIKNDGKEHELTGHSGNLKSWSGCDSVEGSTCKFKADGNKNITATFN